MSLAARFGWGVRPSAQTLLWVAHVSRDASAVEDCGCGKACAWLAVGVVVQLWCTS